jgi:hypothetical protein
MGDAPEAIQNISDGDTPLAGKKPKTKRTKAKSNPKNPRWSTEETEWLRKKLPVFRLAQETQTVGDFWVKLGKEYWTAFPERLHDDNDLNSEQKEEMRTLLLETPKVRLLFKAI